MSTEISQMKKADKMIASRLEDWTYDIIKDMVDKSQGESVSHDFKANIPWFISAMIKRYPIYSVEKGKIFIPKYILISLKSYSYQF